MPLPVVVPRAVPPATLITVRRAVLPAALAAGACAIPLVAGGCVPPWVGPVAIGAIVAVLTYGVANVRSGIFLQSFSAGRRDRPEIALTFDDGPDPEWTPQVLALLAARGIRATFFLIGRRAERHPDLVARLVAAGHEVGVHTYDHGLGYAFRSQRGVRADLRRAIDAVCAAGAPAPRWFRPPNGLVNPRIADEVRRAGLQLVGWTVRPRDGVRAAPDAVFRRVAAALRGGDIVLLHDARSPHDPLHSPAGVRALPRILDLAAARNLRAVTVGELACRGRDP